MHADSARGIRSNRLDHNPHRGHAVLINNWKGESKWKEQSAHRTQNAQNDKVTGK